MKKLKKLPSPNTSFWELDCTFQKNSSAREGNQDIQPQATHQEKADQAAELSF